MFGLFKKKKPKPDCFIHANGKKVNAGILEGIEVCVSAEGDHREIGGMVVSIITGLMAQGCPREIMLKATAQAFGFNNECKQAAPKEAEKPKRKPAKKKTK